MATTAHIAIKDASPQAAIQALLRAMLEQGIAQGVFAPRHIGTGNGTGPSGQIMPALITDPDQLDQVDPLAPTFPLNSARILTRLTHGAPGGVIAALLRPCEIRAFVELVKLNQGSTENLLLMSLDCFGAYTNNDWRAILAKGSGNDVTQAFLAKNGLAGGDHGILDGFDIAPACAVCEMPEAPVADLHLGLAGQDLAKELLLVSNSARGEGVMRKLELSDAADNLVSAREAALKELVTTRTASRDEMFANTAEKVSTPSKLAEYLSACVNCYNCRVACPVCYCRECVFVTDVFDHEPWRYLAWAKKDGNIKLPTDTVFFHMTRLAHMSTSCVGCGQCSNACPNDVAVMELFRMVAAKTQKAFDYMPGRDQTESPPLSIFRENEFTEVTGGAP